MDKKQFYKVVIDQNLPQIKQIIDEDSMLINEIVMGKTWLHFAVKKNNIEMMDYFVSKGIPVDVDWNNCIPPLNIATDNNCYEAADWLLKNGATVNRRDGHISPLVGAIESGNIKLVKLLIQYGVNTDFSWGQFNYTPITYAQSFGASHSEIVNLLQNNMTDQNSNVNDEKNNEIIACLENKYGKGENYSISEIITNMSINIHIIKHTGNEPCTILATSGMSDYEMSVPQGAEDYKYAELIMYLPSNWPLDKESLKEQKYSWPIDWIRRIAHFPKENKTWIGAESAVFSNEEPPVPFADNTKLSCFLALRKQNDDDQVIMASGKKVNFYALYPIYEEERKYQIEKGIPALLEKFQEYNISAILDIERRNVVTAFQVFNK